MSNYRNRPQQMIKLDGAASSINFGSPYPLYPLAYAHKELVLYEALVQVYKVNAQEMTNTPGEVVVCQLKKRIGTGALVDVGTPFNVNVSNGEVTAGQVFKATLASVEIIEEGATLFLEMQHAATATLSDQWALCSVDTEIKGWA